MPQPTVSRRALIVAVLSIAVRPRTVPARRNRSKRRHRQPEPAALPYSWAVDAPPRVVPMRLDVGADWVGPILAAAEMWNTVQPWLRLDLHGTEGAIVVTSPWADEYWGGRADTVYDGPHIVAATVRFDDADYQGRYPWPKEKERQWIAAHELGHALGLPHAPSGDRGCMALDSRHNPKAAPSAWTLRQLALTYAA